VEWQLIAVLLSIAAAACYRARRVEDVVRPEGRLRAGVWRVCEAGGRGERETDRAAAGVTWIET
jgi:hypothetical protein